MDRNKEFEVVISERATEMLVTHVRFLAEVSYFLPVYNF